MKTRLLNGYFAGVYTAEYLEENEELVKDWDLIDSDIIDFHFKKPYWNGSEWIEGESEEDRLKRIETETEIINKEYTKKITDLVGKHVEKLNFEGMPIPQEIKDSRETLREECRLKISQLT